MNKTSGNNLTIDLQLELKYCERCGGLWLRPAGTGQVYCAGCEPEMAELPLATRKRTQAKKPPGPRRSKVVGRNETCDLAGGAA